VTLLGESREEEDRHERAQFANRLFASPRTDPATRRHDGYARDRFHWLLDLKRPPAARPLNPWRELERLTYWLYRAFTARQAQRARLDGYAFASGEGP
jgi:hypothetical protein